MRAKQSNQTAGLIIGGLLIALGIIFLFTSAGVFGLHWGNFWPIFLMLGGIACLIPAFLSEHEEGRSGWVTVGVMLILLSLFYFAATLGWGIGWDDQGTLWPMYLIIFGLGLLAGYAASGWRNNATLAVGTFMTCLGGLLLILTRSNWLYSFFDNFSVNFQFLRDWGLDNTLVTWWPSILIVLGLVLIGIALLPSTTIKSAPVLVGSLLLLLGLFFQVTTLGAISWSDQGKLWPLYPIMFGLALLAAAAASRLDHEQ